MSLASLLYPSYEIFKSIVGTAWSKVYYLPDTNYNPTQYQAYVVVQGVGHVCAVMASADITHFNSKKANGNDVANQDDGLTLANKSPILVSGIL